MSRKEAVLLITRTLSVYLVIWALTDLTYIPQNLFALADHASLTAIVSENYLRNYDLIYRAFLFIRIVALFAAANWFYSCGTKVEHFFFPSDTGHALKGFSTPSWKTLWKNRTILA